MSAANLVAEGIPPAELCMATSCGHLPRAGIAAYCFAGLVGLQQMVGSAQRCFSTVLFSLSVLSLEVLEEKIP